MAIYLRNGRLIQGFCDVAVNVSVDMKILDKAMVCEETIHVMKVVQDGFELEERFHVVCSIRVIY